MGVAGKGGVLKVLHGQSSMNLTAQLTAASSRILMITTYPLCCSLPFVRLASPVMKHSYYFWQIFFLV